MHIELPGLTENKELPLVHFPAPWQAVIFRNFGMVPINRIADILHTDAYTVLREAGKLGLDTSEEVNPDWLKKGYITLIRSNWHLLSYDDICTLLGCTAEGLAFTLKEDDFLSHKLGNFKPHTPDCRYYALTEENELHTEEIASAVREFYSSLPRGQAKPFDFVPMFRRHTLQAPGRDGKRFEERYVYSYCALYGDTFSDPALIDASFPDELLEAYSAEGITGVWVHIVLYNMVEFPFDPSWSEGWQKRQEGMRILTEKLAKYNLKLFLYFNEPRAMPNEFFDKHPELAGVQGVWYNSSLTTLCMSLPEVQNYLRNGVRQLCENVPLLGGFFTITASENLTSCHSHGLQDGCPRCKDVSPADGFVRVNRIIREGASAVNPNIKVIAWSWGWDPNLIDEIAQKLPKGIALMTVSEQGCTKLIGDTETSVLDYSISITGPGEYAKKTWRLAHKYGQKAYAKLQLNNSWESAATPFIPVFDKYYEHLSRLSKRAEDTPDGLMLDWTLGGYPSPVMRIAAAVNNGDGEIPDKQTLYSSLYPQANAVLLTEAFRQLSDAFDCYPFSIETAYQGPQLYAPMNLLYLQPTGFSPTMVGFPYDSLDGWRGRFPRDTYVSSLKKLSDGWKSGLETLRKAVSGIPDEEMSYDLRELLENTEVLGAHFRSMYLQCRFVEIRDDLPDQTDDGLTLKKILAEEETISKRVAAVQAVNPTIGYESTNHYFYTLRLLAEKVISCRYLGKLI